MSLFSAVGLSCGYGSRRILDGVSFLLEAGDLVCLLGPNGAGKSTLLKTLAGQLKPLAGSVCCSGTEVADLYDQPSARRARFVSYVPQEFAPHQFSVLDTVVMGRVVWLGTRPSPEKNDYDVALGALELLRISRFAETCFDKLSGGQKRLVLTARALAAQTPVLLLDEPDSGLDAANRQILYEALQICAQSGKTVLFSSHEPDCARLTGANILLAVQGAVEACQVLSAEKLGAVYGVEFTEAVVSGKNGGRVFVPAALPKKQ